MSKKTEDKKLKFETEVNVITTGQIGKGTTFTTQEVDKLSKPKNADRKRKPTSSKVYGNRIVFKNKVAGGEKQKKKKKLLFSKIKLLSRSANDGRIIFVHYEKDQRGYYFVVGFKDSAVAEKFVNAVQMGNEKVKILEEENGFPKEDTRSVNSFNTSQRGKESNGWDNRNSSESSASQDRNSQLGVEDFHFYNPTRANHTPRAPAVGRNPIQSSPEQSSSSSQIWINGEPAKETFISTWDDGESQYSLDVSDTGSEHMRNPSPRVPPGEFQRFTPGPDGLVTNYVYIGPRDEEESINGAALLPPQYSRESRSRKHTSTVEYYRKGSAAYSNGRNEWLENEPRPRKHASTVEYYRKGSAAYSNGRDEWLENAINSDHRSRGRKSSVIYPPSETTRRMLVSPTQSQRARSSSRQTSHSRRSSRPKQIPLSEDESKRSGWHSDILFVTPKPGGGCKISSDGPVMLFTACRTNKRDSDSSDSSDEEDSLSLSSSTLTINDDELNQAEEAEDDIEINYSSSLRMQENSQAHSFATVSRRL
ncbi:unnamed protein product [Schistocephalus solidus]|uniref:DUF5734 domain-containing protein n=1 Tax=Schistocephalus solidus TaxID=70667 RepID=A0A0X3Q2W6_SCHSO|nr:unnamed protein product [Schistocephalus solidus]